MDSRDAALIRPAPPPAQRLGLAPALRPARRTGAGFTLVEVLVALLIMAVIAVLGWRGIDSMARSREVAQASSERTLRLGAVIGQFEQDIPQVIDTGAAPGLTFDGAALRLTRRSEGSVQVVVWSLREGVWRRWAGPLTSRVGALQEAWLQSQQLLGNEPQQVRLLDGVTGWQVYFFREGAWTNAQSTGDQTQTVGGGNREKLPQGVRLVIDLPEGKLTRDVALGPQAP